MESKVCFFVRKDSGWTYNGIESLKGKKLGVIRSYSYGKELDDYIAAHKNSPKGVDIMSGQQNPLLKNFKKLKAKRLDVVAEDGWVGEYTMGKNMLNDTIKRSNCMAGTGLYIGFTPVRTEQSKKYAKIFDRGIQDLKASGQLKAIFDKYGVR